MIIQYLNLILKENKFKVFDESNSGNHLLKYNKEWY